MISLRFESCSKQIITGPPLPEAILRLDFCLKQACFFVAGGPTFSAGRRKSVFAETYDPEEDEHEEKTVRHFYTINRI